MRSQGHNGSKSTAHDGRGLLLAHATTAWVAPKPPRPLPLRAEPVVSPFEAGENNADAASEAAASLGELEFTPASVDEVLNRVRPYLVADGGDVAVVEVKPETKDVILRLEGACGSCPSSTTTMKMGIERVLRERWPDLGSVVETRTRRTRILMWRRWRTYWRRSPAP